MASFNDEVPRWPQKKKKKNEKRDSEWVMGHGNGCG